MECNSILHALASDNDSYSFLYELYVASDRKVSQANALNVSIEPCLSVNNDRLNNLVALKR